MPAPVLEFPAGLVFGTAEKPVSIIHSRVIFLNGLRISSSNAPVFTDPLLEAAPGASSDSLAVACTSWVRDYVDGLLEGYPAFGSAPVAGNVVLAAAAGALADYGHAPSYLLARANHTGTQLHSTISDFDAAAQALIDATVGALGSHTRNDDDYLDYGGSYQVSANQLKTHINDATKHFVVDDTSTTSSVNTWSVQKIKAYADALVSSQLLDSEVFSSILTVNAPAAPTTKFLRGDNTWVTLDATLTQEQVEDYVAGLIDDSNSLIWTYSDSTGSLTASAKLATAATGKGALVAGGTGLYVVINDAGTTDHDILSASQIDARIAVGAGGVTDGDKTDITVSGSGTVWTLNALSSSPAGTYKGLTGTVDAKGRLTAAANGPVGFTVRVLGQATEHAVNTTLTSFRVPLAFTLTAIYADFAAAGATGNTVIDVNKVITGVDTSIFSGGNLTVASGATYNASQPTLGITAFAARDLITIDIDSVATTEGSGLDITFVGTLA